MRPYLLIKADGKLYCAFIDEPPDYTDDVAGTIRKYAQAKAEAIANAHIIINPNDWFDLQKFHSRDIKVGELYPWNGGAEVEEVKSDFNLVDGWEYQKVVRLSLPDNKDKGYPAANVYNPPIK